MPGCFRREDDGWRFRRLHCQSVGGKRSRSFCRECGHRIRKQNWEKAGMLHLPAIRRNEGRDARGWMLDARALKRTIYHFTIVILHLTLKEIGSHWSSSMTNL